MRAFTRRIEAAGVVVLSVACVPEQAGHDDVRALTAERLGQAARYQAESTAAAIDDETRKLLDQPLDADLAARVAILNSPLLQASFEELGVARAELVGSLRLPNPHVSGALRYREQRPEIEVEAMISLSEFVLWPLRGDVGSAGLDAAVLEVTGRAVDVAFDARAAFYDHQLAEQRLGLARSTLASAWAASDMAARLSSAGNVTELVRASEQAAYEEARLEEARADVDLRRRREALNQALGLYGEAAARWRSKGGLPPPDRVDALVQEVEPRAVAASLELAAGRLRYEQAGGRTRLARVEGWVPELRLGVSAERSEEGWGVGPAAEVEVPLFYQGQGEVGGALAEMRRERRGAFHTAVTVRARARALATQLLAAARGLDFYGATLLPLRERIVDEAQLQYNAMQISVFQLLAAKRDAVLAERGRLELLGEYWTVRNELERLLAGRLGPELRGGPVAGPRSPSVGGPAGH